LVSSFTATQSGEVAGGWAEYPPSLAFALHAGSFRDHAAKAASDASHFEIRNRAPDVCFVHLDLMFFIAVRAADTNGFPPYLGKGFEFSAHAGVDYRVGLWTVNS
jgi:hypothetical protein